MKFIILLMISLMITGCVGHDFDLSVARQIKAGMSREEVIKIVGHEPTTEVISCRNEACVRICLWSYGNAFGEGKALSVTLKNNKVVGN